MLPGPMGLNRSVSQKRPTNRDPAHSEMIKKRIDRGIAGSSSTIAITASDCGLGFFIMVVGKGKMEAGAWAVIDRSPEPAAMVLNNRTADGKSHAHAAGFRGVERVKDLVQRLRVNTYPRVFDRYHHLIRIDIPGGDHQFSRSLNYAAHRFKIGRAH